MPTKKQILEAFTLNELKHLVSTYALEVRDRRVRNELISAIHSSPYVALDEVLADFSRERLKSICRALELDDRGKKKATFLARILDDGPNSDFSEQRGVFLAQFGFSRKQVLHGSKGTIEQLSWSADGSMLVAASMYEEAMRLWDIRTGNSTIINGKSGHLAILSEHRLAVSSHKERYLWFLNFDGSVASKTKLEFSRVKLIAGPRRSILFAADVDVDAWDVSHWPPVRLSMIDTRTSAGPWNGIALSANENFLAAVGPNGVCAWQVSSGKMIFINELSGPKNLYCCAFSPLGGTLLAAGEGGAITGWDVLSGKRLLSVETAHPLIESLQFSADGRVLLIEGGITSLFRTDTWTEILDLDTIFATSYAASLHPSLPVLASATLGKGGEYLIELWEYDLKRLLDRSETRAVQHTTARIVLVGDSGVGKTGLGWRLAHGEFKEHASTHGQQFWVLSQLRERLANGTECEAVLWDLAGQPDYRLIHALFLDDADLALLVFDATHSQDPLRSVEFWLRQLRIGEGARGHEGAGKPCLALLVAARTDRGAPTLTGDELAAFCRANGLRGYYETSAATGKGLDEVLGAIKSLIPWEDMTTTVTTEAFKRVKDFVLGLKEGAQRRRRLIVTPGELLERLAKVEPRLALTEGEVMTAVLHLENYGYVKRLRTSSGEARILLAPELLNNLAASMVIEARRNERGLGALEEARLQSGGYPFPELASLRKDDKETLLDGAALLFLEHNVCFREVDPHRGEAYLIFPELINLRRPAHPDDAAFHEWVSYTTSGAIENLYASLVVLMGYTNTFTRTDQWYQHARYEMSNGAVLGFRQEHAQDGELELVLSCGKNVPEQVRQLFQGLFEGFLSRRDVTVKRYAPVMCECGSAIERATVRRRLRDNKSFVHCDECGSKLALPLTGSTIQLTSAQRQRVAAERQTAMTRTRFEQALFRTQEFAKTLDDPGDCFISYAWGDPEEERWVERLAKDVQKAGIRVILDRWENATVGKSISRFVDRIQQCGRILIIGTPRYRNKYADPARASVVAAEFDLVSQRMLGSAREKESVLPLLRSGTPKTSFPPSLVGRVYADFRDETQYFVAAFDLVLSIYKIAPNEPAISQLRDGLTAGPHRISETDIPGT